jgi:hypothetical protein
MLIRRRVVLGFVALGGIEAAVPPSDQPPAPQQFLQEIAVRYAPPDALATNDVQLIDVGVDGRLRAFVTGQWFGLNHDRWEPLPGLQTASAAEFVLAGQRDTPVRVPIPWAEVRQVLRQGTRTWIATEADPFEVVDGQARSLGWPSRHRVNQIAAAPDGTLRLASAAGLFRQSDRGWESVGALDGLGRAWGVADVRGVAVDAEGRLWFATKAGVGCQTGSLGWRFYEGRDGLPWNDFTKITAAPDGTIWFATHLGLVRFNGLAWAYRQGRRWLPGDDVRQVAVDAAGNAWVATTTGLGGILNKPMTLAEKAAIYEEEISRHIKRTPFGYVAEAPLERRADKSSARPADSDNDGLWTAMYGAGECFAVGATGDVQARGRARQAFEALRFLQEVTQGGPHAPPKGYVARTIRPADWPDPNVGRIEQDRQGQKEDSLWKVYEPRWPKSADGQWYWKSDTSSDELDGHYFFYPLYYDLCAETEAEKERVREVVRDLTDHLLAHGFTLTDHDGRPTRWAVYGPSFLNHDPRWWPESGLNSLSILSYLAVASHITGDPKYAAASRELIDRFGYAQNAMYPKVQHGPGSGNQSDDEMAVMCFYSLLRCSSDDALKAQIRYSFLSYWANEWPEMNPFFNFAYAASNAGQQTLNPYGTFSLEPWAGWLSDSMATLRGFSLDRLNWSHQNSHRLDLQPLPMQAAKDLYERGRGRRAGHVGGKVLPVENRHFNHWNTDPWELDYDGNGTELGAGTVFLLPYYMGLYHGFIEKPTRAARGP